MMTETTNPGGRATGMKGRDRPVLLAVEWVGRAALFSLGVASVLALAVVATVLAAVMLAAVTLPSLAVEQPRRRGRRIGRDVRQLEDSGAS